MKVRMTFDVDAQTRYVLAHYFRRVDGMTTRSRATRRQVQRFAQAALRSAVRAHADALSGRARSVASRLGAPQIEAEYLTAPREQQRSFELEAP